MSGRSYSCRSPGSKGSGPRSEGTLLETAAEHVRCFPPLLSCRNCASQVQPVVPTAAGGTRRGNSAASLRTHTQTTPGLDPKDPKFVFLCLYTLFVMLVRRPLLLSAALASGATLRLWRRRVLCRRCRRRRPRRPRWRRLRKESSYLRPRLEFRHGRNGNRRRRRRRRHCRKRRGPGPGPRTTCDCDGRFRHVDGPSRRHRRRLLTGSHNLKNERNNAVHVQMFDSFFLPPAVFANHHARHSTPHPECEPPKLGRFMFPHTTADHKQVVRGTKNQQSLVMKSRRLSRTVGHHKPAPIEMCSPQETICPRVPRPSALA